MSVKQEFRSYPELADGRVHPTQTLRRVPAPVADLAQAFADCVLKESYFMAGVFEFVDVGPDLGLPR